MPAVVVAVPSMPGAATMRPEPESSVPRERLTAFTPLPPERNGIADYAAMLLGALSGHYDCEAACADWLAEAPPGVALVDPALAHRGVADDGRVLHQLGNNPGHGFVLEALRRVPGVTTLHDPGLLHLRQTLGATRGALPAGRRRRRVKGGERGTWRTSTWTGRAARGSP